MYKLKKLVKHEGHTEATDKGILKKDPIKVSAAVSDESNE